MKKREFLDLLRFYLKDMPKIVTEDIISDYEEHFAIATEKGKREEEICKELGSPEAIAKEYISGEKIHFISEDVDDKTKEEYYEYKKEKEKKDREKLELEKEENKKIFLKVIKVLGVILAVLILPPMFGVGMGVVGFIVKIISLLFMGFIMGIWWILSLVFMVIQFICSIIITIFRTIYSLFFVSFYREDFWNAVSTLNPATSLFATFTLIAFCLLIICLMIIFIRSVIRIIKNIYITIRWKKRRKSNEKTTKDTDYSDVDM